MTTRSRKACSNLYDFIRLRLGRELSDREIARRWGMEWKSFTALRHDRRQMPRVKELERLAEILAVDAAFVFEVARGVPARRIHELLQTNAQAELAELLMKGLLASRRESEAAGDAFGAVLDRIGDAVFTIDLQGRFRDANVRLYDLLHYSAEELHARSIYEVVLVGDAPRLMEALAKVYAQGEVRSAEIRARDKHGTELVLEVTATRIQDAQGNAIGAQAVARDVTQTRQLEQQLRQQHETLRATFEGVPAACLLFAQDGTILLANQLVENVCEHTADEIIGRNAFAVFGNPGPEGCPVTRAFQSGRLEQQVSKVTNRHGAEVYVHRTAGPVAGAGGGVERIVEILVDVSDQLRRGDPKLLELWRDGPLPPGQALWDVERRSFMRVPFELEVSLSSGGEHRAALMQNLARGGVSLETDVPLPRGTEVAMEWRPERDAEPVRAKGIVAWSIAGTKGGRGSVGVEFTEISAADRERIVACLFACMKRSA